MSRVNKGNESFKEITRIEFYNFARTLNKCSYEQTVEMGDLRKSRGYDIRYLAAIVDEKIKVAALVYFQSVLGGKTVGIYYGPIYDEDEKIALFLNGLKDYVKRQDVLKLTIFPYDDFQLYSGSGLPLEKENTSLLLTYKNAGFHYQGQQTGFTDDQIFWHYVKDLSNISVDNLEKSFSKKGRSMLKKAKTFGIKLRALGKEELDIFAKLVSVTARRRGYESKEVDYYVDLFNAFNDKAEFMIASLNFNDYLNNILKGKRKLESKLNQLNENLAKQPKSEKKQNRIHDLSEQLISFKIREEEAQTLVKKYGDKEVILAGSLFLYTPQELVYLYSGSYNEFNKFYAPALLQDYAMDQALKKGIKFYNMLGVTGKFDGSDGVLRFKQNFNGYIIQKFSSFTYYPHRLKSSLIQGLKVLLGWF